MKQIIATVLLALAGLVTVQSALAQNYRVKASIPFNFVVGSNKLPAGTYTFSSPDNLALQVQNDKQYATVLSSVRADDVQSEKVRLIFNMYGDQYFLSKILCPSSNLNLKLPVSRLEKKVRLQQVKLVEVDQDPNTAHYEGGK
jgi:hypothetical protein